MEIRTRQHMNVTMSEIQKRFQAAPYGWREIDVAALVATLVRRQKLQLIYNGAALLPSDRRVVDCLRKRSETEKTLVRQKISAPDVLVKKARSLASELFGAMDLRTDEENLCGQLETLLTEANRRNGELLARYSPAVAYPGREVVESGKRVLDEILARRGDNIAFLETFTKAEDELLDWSEDVREVEFFFQNQRKIFDSAWEKCATVQREHHYFADEAEALASADAMSAIFKSPKPYRRIVELPTLAQKVDMAYERISESRRERVREILIQARGDIHTLAGDESELRDEIRKADEELKRREQEALSAASPTLLDASITQILTYKESVCRRLEQKIAIQEHPELPKLRIKTLRRYDVLPQKRLASADDVNAYVEALRAKLMESLKDNDAIQMN